MRQIAEIDDEAWEAATREFLKARDEEARLECRFRIVTWALAILGALALVVAGYAYPALAHTTETGQTFSTYCCNGRDCQEIPKSSVEIDPSTNLVHVTLNVGDHPMVTKPHEFTFKYTEVKWTIDGLYYACLYPDENTLRCLYLPPPSF